MSRWRWCDVCKWVSCSWMCCRFLSLGIHSCFIPWFTLKHRSVRINLQMVSIVPTAMFV
jgi:hypothetical protein